jgi:adenosylmethionine-8-amino-7-oxononanoate aminotransferase
MEAAIKLAKQYFWEINQPQRKYFISRYQSYHGNTLGALALSNHPFRRAPYDAILNHESFHYVSPAYYKRYAQAGESEEQYVARLAQELEDKFQELGPENVIGCMFSIFHHGVHSSDEFPSRRRAGRWSHSGSHIRPERVLRRHQCRLPKTWCTVDL